MSAIEIESISKRFGRTQAVSDLSFSVAPDVHPLPKSLVNIYKELMTDVGCPPPANGDLSPWFDQGVMLLNRCLTVAPGAPA